MQRRMMLFIAVLLPLFFLAVPVQAETLSAPDMGMEPIEIGRHRTVLPNGVTYDYDVSFPAQVRVLRADGTVQAEEVTCYFKSKTPPADKPPMKGSKPPTKGDVGAGVPPDNAAVTNGVSGLGGGVDPTTDPNDDPGEPAPDVGGGD